MSTTINLPVLLAQLPHLAKVASVQQQSPKNQALFAEELAREQGERAKERVEKTKDADKSSITDDQHHQEEERHEASHRREHEPEEEPQEEETPPLKSPWAGNIINLKI